MKRSRAQNSKRRPILESLETRETPSTMGLSAAWASGLRIGPVLANPPSTNISVNPNGTTNPPGNLFSGGMATTHSLRIGPVGTGAIGLGAPGMTSPFGMNFPTIGSIGL